MHKIVMACLIVITGLALVSAGNASGQLNGYEKAMGLQQTDQIAELINHLPKYAIK